MSSEKVDFLDSMKAKEEETPAEVPEIQEPETVVKEVPATPAEEVPTTPSHEPEMVPLAALKSEREKRQRFERELEESRKRPVEPVAPPDFYQDPEGHIQAAVNQVRQEANDRVISALEGAAKAANPDYDEVMGEVLEHMASQPPAVQEMLKAQVFQSQNPAMEAYTLGKKLREMREMQDPGAFRKKVEAEVRAKLEAEFAKKAKQATPVDDIPPDLTDTPSATSEPSTRRSPVFKQLFDT
jgi:hypothetical protein